MESKNAILIIDDDPALLKMAGEILRSDYEVSCVKSGREALALMAGDYMPDIILLDVDMPGLNGFETLPLLHQIEDAQDIPVLFLTGANQPEAELKGFSSGAVDYITKPFIKEILLARLKVHFENGKRLRQLSMMEKYKHEHAINEESFTRLSFDLTDTEKKVLRLIALGFTNKEIAETLSYSYNYIKKVANSIYEKKCVNRRADIKKLMQ